MKKNEETEEKSKENEDSEEEEDRGETEEADNLETSFEDLSDFFPAFDPKNLILESGEAAPSPTMEFENLEDSLGGVFQGIGRRDEDRDYVPRADYEEKQDDYKPREHQRVEITEAPILREQEEIINPFAPQTELRHFEEFERAKPRDQFEDFQKQQEKYEVEDDEKKLPFERKRERGEII